MARLGLNIQFINVCIQKIDGSIFERFGIVLVNF